jgi:hypothetical protein
MGAFLEWEGWAKQVRNYGNALSKLRVLGLVSRQRHNVLTLKWSKSKVRKVDKGTYHPIKGTFTLCFSAKALTQTLKLKQVLPSGSQRHSCSKSN